MSTFKILQGLLSSRTAKDIQDAIQMLKAQAVLPGIVGDLERDWNKFFEDLNRVLRQLGEESRRWG
jgi:hypothetical protein